MGKKSFLLTLFMMLFYASIWAQAQLVSGVVYDNDSNPLPGASVVVKGSQETDGGLVGTVTNMYGEYELEVKPNDVLVFSFMGFKTKEVDPEGLSNVDVYLESSAEMLDDVVVVGYGIQKKASVVGSISQIDGEDLLEVGSPSNISQAIQGLMPGVTAISSTGKPGADAAEIIIRGRASWRTSTPLVLVDGVERDMNDVDPNEIDNISVLKDASATAVYGVKGANGVILITTKRGTESKPVINFSSNFGFKVPSGQPEFADYSTAMEMWNEALINDQRWGDLIPESKIDAWKRNISEVGPYNDYYPQIDWWDEMVKDVGYQQQHNINLKGGTEFLKYFASLGYLHDGDIFKTQQNDLFDPAFYYERYNWRSNFDFNLTQTTKVAVNLSGSLSFRNQTGYRINSGDVSEDGYGQPQFFEGLYLAGANEFPIQYSDGEWGSDPTGAGNLVLAFDKGQRKYRYYKGFLDFNIEQKLDFITKGLKFDGKFSYSSRTSHQDIIVRYAEGPFGKDYPIRYSRVWDYTNPNPDGSLPLIQETRWPDDNAQNPFPDANYGNIMNGGFRKNYEYEMALNYARGFSDHNVTALALFSRREDSGLGGKSISNIMIPSRREDYVGRVTYNWKEKYLMEFNGAYNGSERFARGKRFGFFPSLSVGWRLSEESFIHQTFGHFLNNLKLRYSYGQSGFDNIPGNRFAYIQTYNTAGNVFFGTNASQPFGPRYLESGAANPNATWETSTKQNLGMEIKVFNKLTLTTDIFKEERDGILMNVWSPSWLGVSDASGNVGETKNHGAEFELGWNDAIGPDFKYWIKGNASFNENRIVYRNDGKNMEPYLREAGKPVYWVSRYQTQGYYESLDDIFNYSTPENTNLQSRLVPGDLMYADYNGDGVIDSNDRIVMENVKYPLNTYSLSLGFNFKGFSLSARFYGVNNLSKDVDNVILYDLWTADQGVIKAGNEVLGRWTPETSETAIKPVLHASSSVSDYSQMNSSYGYRNASYLRLKFLEGSYTFQNINKLGLNNLKIYVNGNNLLTFTDLDSRMDPETSGSDVYPMIKRFNIGFRASF